MATEPSSRVDWRNGLSFRVLALTVGVILFVELLILIPSAARFQNDWLRERAQAGRVAALALEAAPSRMVSNELATDLLTYAEVVSVAEMGGGIREQLLPPRMSISELPMRFVDIRRYSVFQNLGELARTLNSPDDRILVIRAMGSQDGRVIEVLTYEQPLRDDLVNFIVRIIGLSLLISGAAGLAIFWVLFRQVVQPVQELTGAVVAFSKDPGGATRRMTPKGRRDEIGQAQTALADMEETVSDAFRQKERLAQLGEAMAKINHDLRNSLATAQLATETLSRSEDPRVQRAAPRLERSIERAITLAQQTLEYGRAEPPKAKPVSVDLKSAADLASEEALPNGSAVAFDNQIPDGATAMADPDHLHRVLVNLMRNAAQAMDGQERDAEIKAALSDGQIIEISDTGPGLPERAQANLFKPFAGSSKRDGTGLGLAIARELSRAMGGDLKLARTGENGTAFEISIARA